MVQLLINSNHDKLRLMKQKLLLDKAMFENMESNRDEEKIFNFGIRREDHSTMLIRQTNTILNQLR